MPPRNKKQNDFAMPEEKLVAVVLCDSYQPNFMPLTIEKPRCLLPLANTPLIEYTLEFLATAKVSKVYVYCCALAEMVEDYVNNSKWKHDAPFEIETVKVPESLSVGDAMRDLDAKGLIESDFLLISGDVVCNIDFQKVWRQHRETRDKDRNAIMSMVLREASALHRTRPRAHPGIFVLDEATGKCLRYEEATTHRGKRINGRVAIDADLINEYDNLQFRNDLIDCRIDICSPDVPALFQENFDYDELRSDFVRGILTSDLLGKTIYAQVLTDNSYAARVESPQTYSAVGKDIVSRYTYPICPDSNMLDDQKYSYQRGHIYKEEGIVLSQSAQIGQGSVIGSETFIGAKSSVKNSVIGRRCKIGENVRIDGAYIWDDVTIEDNVVINEAVIANGAVIKKDSIVESGAIISYGVIIGRGMTVPRNVKLTKQLRVRIVESDDDDEFSGDEESGRQSRISSTSSLTSTRTSASHQTGATSIVGEDGEGYLYHGSDFESDTDDDDANTSGGEVDGLIYRMEQFDMSDSSLDSMKSSGAKHKHHRSYSTTSATSANSGLSDENDAEDFSKEVVASIERSLMDNHTQEIALLELNTLRMTMNAPHEKLRSATIQALIAHIARMVTTETLDVKQATEQLFQKWTMVLTRITHGDDDEADLLQDIQEECTRRPQGNKILFYAASVLYDNDVVKEDNIYRWWNSQESVATDQLKSVRELTGRWVDWLKNAEEESGSEEDSD